MKIIGGLILVALASGYFVCCGKKSSDDSASTTADSMTSINSLSIGCGAKKVSCVGTQAE